MKAYTITASLLIFALSITTISCGFIGITNRTNNEFAVIWSQINASSSSPAPQIHTSVFYSNELILQNNSVIASDTHTYLTDPAQIVGTSDGGHIALWVQGSDTGFFAKVQIFDNQYLPVGVPIDVSSKRANYIIQPDIAIFSDDSFVVVFNDGSDERGDLYFQIFDKNGSKASSLVQVSQNQTKAKPTVCTLTSDDFVVTWVKAEYSSQHIYYQRFDSSGNNNTDITRFESRFLMNDQPVIAGMADGGYVITIQVIDDPINNCYQVYFSRFSSSNSQMGGLNHANFELPCPQSVVVDVTALIDGGFVINWVETGDLSHFSTYSQRYSVISTRVGQAMELDHSDTVIFSSIVGLNNDNYVVFWVKSDANISEYEGYIQEINALNKRVGEIVTVFSTKRQQVLE